MIINVSPVVSRWFLPLALASLAVACSGVSPTPPAVSSASSAADRACSGVGLTVARAYGGNASVVASFGLTASALADWDERPQPPNVPRIVKSQLRERPPDEPVFLCYYDGDFRNFGRGPGPVLAGADPPTQTPPEFSRLVLIASGDRADLRSIGPRANMPIEDPTQR